MKMTVYDEVVLEKSDIEERIRSSLRDEFATTLSQAKEIFNADEISKFKVTVSVENIDGY